MNFDKFEKYGDYHWKEWESGYPKTVRHIKRLMDWIQEKSVLDIGAGDGLLVGLMGIKGIEVEPSGVAWAEKHGADVILGDAYKLPFNDEEFESAFMGDTLEHLEFPEKALREARRVISKYLYVANPIKRPKKEKRHYQEWAPEELTTLVESCGFKLEGEVLTVSEDRRDYAKFRKDN